MAELPAGTTVSIPIIPQERCGFLEHYCLFRQDTTFPSKAVFAEDEAKAVCT